MRIGHLLPYDTNLPGGVQTHTLALSDALTSLGHESRIFAPSHPLRLPLGGTRVDFSLHPSDILALLRFLRTPRDILHIQEPVLPLLGLLALAHSDAARTVVTLHSAETAARRLYRLTAPLSRRLLDRADAVIVASDVSRGIAASILPDAARVHQIFPCLDLGPFHEVRTSPETDRDRDAILFVGRDEPRKGLPALLEAMHQLPDADLIVAGPVTQRTRRLADERLPGRVEFLGPVPRDALPALMARADVAAFPATGGEALGLVIVEAMAAGVPVAASDIEGYRIATDADSADGAAALLSPPADTDALAANLRRLLAEPDLRARLVQRGRAAAERFDAAAIARQHLALYQSLLAAN